MPTFNITQTPGALVAQVNRPQLAQRSELHYNPLAQAGLAVNDTVLVDAVVPDWCRTIVVSKRTNTANADVLTVQCQDPNLPIAPTLPIKTANQVQTGGSTANNAANAVLMQLYPVGNLIRVSLTFVTSLPAQCLLSIGFYDE
ncbi:MAG: hypothetical protein ACK4MG_04155 [Aquabacterium sp.]|uniref:hypothetical protein n=1 Tax=uncultured Aquabacterium sp. TaxID=158753 RepID=UPI0025F42AFC|nr:hypothetical protein [uncultured Aquabacterium sp.]